MTRKKRKKVLVGMREGHYAKPHRELVDIDYWNKLSDTDKAWYARTLHNYHGSRMHKDGFDVVYNNDERRKEASRDASKRRVDTYGAMASGTARYNLDAEEDNVGSGDVRLACTPNYITGTQAYRGAGYSTDNWELEEDAMIAELDRKLGKVEH